MSGGIGPAVPSHTLARVVVAGLFIIAAAVAGVRDFLAAPIHTEVVCSDGGSCIITETRRIGDRVLQVPSSSTARVETVASTGKNQSTRYILVFGPERFEVGGGEEALTDGA